MNDQDLNNIGIFLAENFEIVMPPAIQSKRAQDRFENMRSILISRIEELITSDFEGLMNLLYRIDVNEQRLKEKLVEAAESSAAVVVADMIIERQLQKIESRKQHGAEGEEWSFDV